jgi:hypothetical protein
MVWTYIKELLVLVGSAFQTRFAHYEAVNSFISIHNWTTFLRSIWQVGSLLMLLSCTQFRIFLYFSRMNTLKQPIVSTSPIHSNSP